MSVTFSFAVWNIIIEKKGGVDSVKNTGAVQTAWLQTGAGVRCHQFWKKKKKSKRWKNIFLSQRQHFCGCELSCVILINFTKCSLMNMNIHPKLHNESIHNSCERVFLHYVHECAHFHTCSWWVCRLTAYCDHFQSPPDTSRVPLHQGHNGAIRRLIMLVWSTGRPARRQSRTASLMAHYSLLNDHTDDPNSVAGCPHSACLKKHFSPLAKVHYKMVDLVFLSLWCWHHFSLFRKKIKALLQIFYS